MANKSFTQTSRRGSAQNPSLKLKQKIRLVERLDQQRAMADQSEKTSLPAPENLILCTSGRNAFQRYGFAVLSVLGIVAAKLLLVPFLSGENQFLLFTIAVIFSAIYGGPAAGLFATLLSSLLTLFFFIHPPGRLPVFSTHLIFDLMLFIMQSVVVSWLVGRLLREQQEQLLLIREHIKQQRSLETAETAARRGEFQENERKWLESVLNLSPCPILLVEPNTGKTIFSNRAAASLFKDAPFVETGSAITQTATFSFKNAEGLSLQTHEMPSMRVALGEKLEASEIQFETPLGTSILLVYADALPAMFGHPRTCILVFQNITSVREAESALKQSEKKFRILFESGIVGIISASADGRVTDANQAFLSMIGYSREDLEQGKMCWKELTPPEFSEADQYWIRHAGIYGSCGPYEKQLIRRDGTKFWVLVGGAYLDERQPIGIGFVLDIDVRKKMEQELRDSENRFRNLVEHIPANIYLSDPAAPTRCLYTSPQLGIMLSLDSSSPTLNPRLWEKSLHEEDRERVLRNLHQAHVSAISFRDEYRLVDAHGKVIWISDQANWIRDSEGKIVYLQGVRFDVSQQKSIELALRRSEEKFRSLIEHASDGVVIGDLEGRVLEVNTSACALLGISYEEFIDRKLKDFVPENELARFETHKQELLQGKSILDEWKLIRKDGHLLDVEVSTKFHPDGRWQFFLRDISERKRVQQTIRNINQELERRVQERTSALQEANLQMEAFTYSVAHDLRAPIRAIKGFTQIIQEDFDPSLNTVVRDYLDRIKTAALRMEKLINGLLAYSRTSREELPLYPVSVQMIIDDLLHRHHALIEERKAIILQQLPYPTVRANNVALYQVLEQLILNAVKFVIPEVEPRIKVWSETLNHMIKIYVQDNGIGIDPQYHERVFGVFERLHTSREYEGTGIGLAIARKSVERMGGWMGLESEVGKGSKFWVELPMA